MIAPFPSSGYLDTMNAGLALENKQVNDDLALRKAAIDATVAMYNAMSKWKSSFHVVDIPKGG